MDHSRAELSKIAMDVATQAGELVMRGFRQRQNVSRKDEEQLVTEYDFRSEELVRRLLAECAPGVAVIGEEQGGEPAADGGLTWYIDPIDGTNNFIAGNPIFAISLGLRDKGQPVVGAVVAPALGLRWGGALGGPVLRNGAPCRVSSTESLSDAIITTGYPTRSGVLSPSVYTDIVCRFRDVRRCGSAAVELSWVADGTYDVYWSQCLPYWDTTAGAALILAAGGTWRGGGASAAEPHDIATNGKLESEFDSLVS